MNQPQFVITHISIAGPQRLGLTFADGYRAEVDLSGLIAKCPPLARLSDRKLFAKAALDEWRRGVIFSSTRHQPPNARVLPQRDKAYAQVHWTRHAGLGIAASSTQSRMKECRHARLMKTDTALIATQR
ncbi:hypothetical protein [Bordetella tumulicola]|uniref:hypothetical protein n=1 Tax=Bordetella tumulicola TaxID=1649133 RepID=UPI0039F0662A